MKKSKWIWARVLLSILGIVAGAVLLMIGLYLLLEESEIHDGALYTSLGILVVLNSLNWLLELFTP